MTIKYFPTATIVLTAFSLPNSMLCTELFCSSVVNLDNIISSAPDSLSGLQSLCGYSPDHPIVIELLIQFHLRMAGKSVAFCWIPGHSGLPGNEAADATAKSAAFHGPLAYDRALGSDVSAFLHRAVISSWQDEWTNSRGNKLRAVRAGMELFLQFYQKGWSHADRLRISHTRLTNGNLLRGVPASLFFNCDVPLTVAHIVVDCPVMVKHAVHITFTALCRTCSVMIAVAFLEFWLL
jgi:hypothetical protein